VVPDSKPPFWIILLPGGGVLVGGLVGVLVGGLVGTLVGVGVGRVVPVGVGVVVVVGVGGGVLVLVGEGVGIGVPPVVNRAGITCPRLSTGEGRPSSYI
jgi:hypothetical protein